MVRGIGGSVGSAIGSVIITHVLRSDLPENWKSLGTSTFSKPPYDRMSPSDAKQTVFAYEHAFGWVFLIGAIAMALCFLICALISDHGLQREEIKQKERRMSAEHI
jgi:hypothetical protein